MAVDPWGGAWGDSWGTSWGVIDAPLVPAPANALGPEGVTRWQVWQMSVGEAIVFGASLRRDMAPGSVLTGTELGVSVWRRTARDQYEPADGFSVELAQVNAAPFRPAGSRADVEPGEGIVYRLDGGDALPGSYEVRLEADASDGTHPVRVAPLVVTGPGRPA